MTKVLKLVRGSSAVDLQSGAPGYQLLPGWLPKVATPIYGRSPGPVVEELPIRISGTSHDDLASKLQALHEMQVGADAYIRDRATIEPVWLHARLTNETNERRALVRRMSLAFQTRWFGPEANQNVARVMAAIEREPYWEALTPTAAVSATGLSVLCGTVDYTASPGSDVVGDVPARLYELRILTESGTTETYEYVWLGFRSANKHGTLSNFVPLWECENGTAGTDTAAATDATASPGGTGNTKMTCSFSTEAGWARRCTIRLDDVVQNYDYEALFGRFLVLMRAKVDSGTVAEARICQLYTLDPTVEVRGPTVEVSSTDWTMHEMGYVTIPLRDPQTLDLSSLDDIYEKSFALAIDARRTSGSGSLHLDCLVLIPVDEYFISVSNAKIDYDLSTFLYISVSPTNRHFAVTAEPAGETTDAQIHTVGIISADGIGVPVGDGRMYCVLARADRVNDIDDTWYVSRIRMIPRWLSLRGNE